MPKKLWITLVALVLVSFGVTAYKAKNEVIVKASFETGTDSLASTEVVANDAVSSEKMRFTALYDVLNLQNLKLNKQAFQLAINGYSKLKTQGKIKNDLLTIIDFSQPSTSKRMYIIDMKKNKLVRHSHVAHGRNTGLLMATTFSNKAESYQSSLGFYVTSETYIGKHGLSLRLDGVERNINDNARARAIVVHGADYANESFYKSTGYLGRSFGCPAVPTKDAPEIIQNIKNGSCMFIYSTDKGYLKQSSLI
ncbi:murein L,D-transpeptidase catalytic domain family protein [Aridibaculum aurantiacum]|uniref:murein L,D-transpeptidase catalytic domain family protein n=1 Tax=Aridibaculum aurantiacum TaxID=2810307 RepID=UPI001A966372|nr:murein L,D-transpeptidase catalytic domain family protein [Aridibaculum aurantiacum]